MAREIYIEADLGKKGVERCDIAIYFDGKLIAHHFDKSYDDFKYIADELKAEQKDAELEIWCSGDDCCGRTHRWKIDIQTDSDYQEPPPTSSEGLNS